MLHRIWVGSGEVAGDSNKEQWLFTLTNAVQEIGDAFGQTRYADILINHTCVVLFGKFYL